MGRNNNLFEIFRRFLFRHDGLFYLGHQPSVMVHHVRQWTFIDASDGFLSEFTDGRPQTGERVRERRVRGEFQSL